MAEIQKVIYDQIPEEDRKVAMRESADEVTSGTYIRPLDISEVNVKKDELAKAIIERNRIAVEFDQVKQKYKDLLKPQERIIAECSEILRTESEEVDGVLYGFKHDELRVMVSYDETGRFVSTRPLKSHEQTTIFTQIRKPLNESAGDYELREASGQ